MNTLKIVSVSDRTAKVFIDDTEITGVVELRLNMKAGNPHTVDLRIVVDENSEVELDYPFIKKANACVQTDVR